MARSSGYDCVCPVGLPLKQDGRTCEESKLFFFLFTPNCSKVIM